jgi:hypothetical protein
MGSFLAGGSATRAGVRMNGWALPTHRHPIWRGLGWTIMVVAAGLTYYFVGSGSEGLTGRRTNGDNPFGESISGKVGTLTETLGASRLIFNYESIQGAQNDLLAQKVKGSLDDASGHWTMESPSARKNNLVWTVQAPMKLDLISRDGKAIGKGFVPGEGGALRWDKGQWLGLGPLVWEGDQGSGRGEWKLPVGWRRELDGKLQVDKGPVQWRSRVPSTLKSMEAQKLWATPGFLEGRLEQVNALLSEGTMKASVAELSPTQVTWPAPLSFERSDGWKGEAASGVAPRPKPGDSFSQVELKAFRAKRTLPTGDERLNAQGARWTPAGLRLEGDIQWEQPLEDQRLTLRAPRVFIREGKGTDLPADLPEGFAAAEGQAVLSWGRRSLSSPRIQVQRATRKWTLQAPVAGRSEEGTFSGGAGKGDPKAWVIEGPVQLNLLNGGTLRGAQLLWESATWTLTGRPATWLRLRERLSGPRLIRKNDSLSFPEGINGALAAADGDLVLRAGQGQSESLRVLLNGGVECQGQGWRLVADVVVITLTSDRQVERVSAKGNVTLRGRLGEGQGEALELDLNPKTGAQNAKWQGRVRGQGQGPGF